MPLELQLHTWEIWGDMGRCGEIWGDMELELQLHTEGEGDRLGGGRGVEEARLVSDDARAVAEAGEAGSSITWLYP